MKPQALRTPCNDGAPSVSLTSYWCVMREWGIRARIKAGGARPPCWVCYVQWMFSVVLAPPVAVRMEMFQSDSFEALLRNLVEILLCWTTEGNSNVLFSLTCIWKHFWNIYIIYICSMSVQVAAYVMLDCFHWIWSEFSKHVRIDMQYRK